MKKMKNASFALAGTLLSTSAFAGGLDLSGQSSAVLFEEGNYFELSLGYRNAEASGSVFNPFTLANDDSGDVAESKIALGAAYKRDITSKSSIALIFDNPFGGKLTYPAYDPSGEGSAFYGGTAFDISSYAITALASYEVTDRVHLFGGLRFQQIDANAAVPAVGNYYGEIDTATGLGYVLGVAYVRPELAQRFSLTYNSEVTHETKFTEQFGGVTANQEDTDIVTPQSINLELQTGINEKTLVFGSVRWADWSEVEVAPTLYTANAGAPLLSYENDSVTYTLGVGRKINEQLSAAVSLTYEKEQGGEFGATAPTDGVFGVTVGGTYQLGNGFELTAGLNYSWLGDTSATTPVPVEFEDNSAIGAGLKISRNF